MLLFLASTVVLASEAEEQYLVAEEPELHLDAPPKTETIDHGADAGILSPETISARVGQGDRRNVAASVVANSRALQLTTVPSPASTDAPTSTTATVSLC